MNAYSKDLRLRVLDAVERGVPRREVSEFLGISISTISRYVKLKASGEDLAPKPSPGRRAKILLDDLVQKRALWRQLEENDTATLREHSEMFEERRGISVSVATMSRALCAPLLQSLAHFLVGDVVGQLRRHRARLDPRDASDSEPKRRTLKDPCNARPAWLDNVH